MRSSSLYKIINSDPPSASALNPDVPEAMDAVIRKAMEKDLYSRYKNGAEFAKDLTAVQFKIFDENDRVPDSTRFGQIRKLPFFTEFEDIEIWEVVRFSQWRVVEALTQVVKEGGSDQRFGILLEGQMEVSIGGKQVYILGPGDSFGESAYMDSAEHRQHAAVVSLTEARYLEISPAALALTSEECAENFRNRLVSGIVKRLANAESALARGSVTAAKASDATSFGMELQLLDD